MDWQKIDLIIIKHKLLNYKFPQQFTGKLPNINLDKQTKGRYHKRERK